MVLFQRIILAVKWVVQLIARKLQYILNRSLRNALKVFCPDRIFHEHFFIKERGMNQQHPFNDGSEFRLVSFGTDNYAIKLKSSNPG